MTCRCRIVSLVVLVILAGACTPGQNDNAVSNVELPETSPAEEPRRPLTVYTSGDPGKIRAVLDAYTVETGIEVELLGDRDQPRPGTVDDPAALPDADLVFANSLAELATFADANVFRPASAPAVAENIPAELRDAESLWVGLTQRLRIIFFNRDLVTADEMRAVTSYASLGDETWQGKLCLSSSRVAGNRSLVAMLIDSQELRDTEISVRRWRANLATAPFADDSELIRAVAEGQCAIGIADTNRILEMITANKDWVLAAHFLAAPGSMLVDISGAGVSRHAHNAAGANSLLEWLSDTSANALLASLDYQLPANPAAPVSRSLAGWSTDMTLTTTLSDLGYLQQDAISLNERARYP